MRNFIILIFLSRKNAVEANCFLLKRFHNLKMAPDIKYQTPFYGKPLNDLMSFKPSYFLEILYIVLVS